ncbi:MAG: peroxiredoxin [Oceanococcus sp.]
MKIAVGDALPAIELPATGEQSITFTACPQRIMVLYFYPKDSTPGCTLEGLDFSALHDDFVKAGACVFGVSKDSMRRHENFKAKQSFPFELLSDEEEALCQAFGVIQEKKLYGKTYMGIVRSTFVFVDGKLARIWDKVKVKGHAQDVLDFVSSQ